MNLKAQTISADAFIAVALFMIVLIFFFSFSGDKTAEIKVKDLETESSKLASAVSGVRNETPSFLEGTKINIERLKGASEMTYSELKNALGIGADFCIHFEDEGGNVIEIREGIAGLGSSYIIVGDMPCGTELSEAEVIICEEAETAGECDRVLELGITQQQCCSFAGVCCE